jgi:hypothetical protein
LPETAGKGVEYDVLIVGDAEVLPVIGGAAGRSIMT